MFYTFVQNNSGGRFITNDNLRERVIIEADTADEANTIAEGIGIYFDGVRDGRDCECCGSRWSRAYDDDGYPVPSMWGTPIPDDEIQFTRYNEDYAVIIYYKDDSTGYRKDAY